MQLGSQLPDKAEADSQGGQADIKIYLSEHRLAPAVSPEPAAVQPAHTHDCTAKSSTIHIVKLADDTTGVGLITDNDESAYRKEVKQLAVWCRSHNLAINVDKGKEMVIKFRKSDNNHHTPLTINGAAVERVNSVKFFLHQHHSSH